MGQKGNNFVEYALMLGLVVGIGWGVLGAYGDGIPGVFGSAAELLQAGSKSDKVYDRHMKWLKETLLPLAKQETGNGFTSFEDFMGGTNGKNFNLRNGPQFTMKDGQIDSDSLSKFVKQIDSTALGSDSWAMVGYKENGQLYYAVAIYSPDKNGGTTLDKQKVGTTVKTDVYRVDPATNEIKRLENNRSMQVAVNTLNGNTYHVLRDLK
ncbi:MAG: hypothetical protein MR969_05235 [Dialister sp.]|nr:hypothetical protein [Dialister sp.]MCI7172669.1 hypothetical protein [Dialister sp.]MDD6904700.1 hypothetical protein [Dialister sp.]MDY5062570.1 hypothetical protein [Dialister sp.]